MVGHKALQLSDRDGFIDLLSSAFRLTGVWADSPQHARQGESLHNQLDGLLVFPLPDELDIPLDIDSRRTGGLPILSDKTD